MSKNKSFFTLLGYRLIDAVTYFFVSWMFANGPGDRGSIPGWVIPKTKKMALDASLFNTQYYKLYIKGKWINPGKGVAPSPTPQCKVSKVKLGDPKAPFTIATTPRCRGGCYAFPWIALLYPWSVPIMLCVKQGGIKYHLLSLWYDSTWDWTQVSRAIGEHSNHDGNVVVI